MKLHPPKSSPLSNNAGFTLLEIIAVLVILGILAVVAVPRYFNLQADAQIKAFDAAEAEVRGLINNYFAKQILSGTAPDDIDYAIPNIAPASGTLAAGNLGDFTITSLTGNILPATDISVTITGTDPSLGGQTRSFTVPRPAAP